MGKNKNANKKLFKTLCRMAQGELKTYLDMTLRKYYDDVVNENGFLFAKGKYPVLLIAHMDTVHEELPNEIIDQNGKISSPNGIGGDDRCGIYMILQIIKHINCSVIFTEDEEIGGVGANKFVKYIDGKKFDANFIVEFDRKGKNDAVFYDGDNRDFIDFVESSGFYKEAYGTYSDICDIAPALDLSAVNLSCGYYNAHTKAEYVIWEEMNRSINEATMLILMDNGTRYEWIECPVRNSKYSNCLDYKYYYDGYGNEFGYDDDDFVERIFTIEYADICGDHKSFDIEARSEAEAIGYWCAANEDLTFSDIISIEAL